MWALLTPSPSSRRLLAFDARPAVCAVSRGRERQQAGGWDLRAAPVARPKRTGGEPGARGSDLFERRRKSLFTPHGRAHPTLQLVEPPRKLSRECRVRRRARTCRSVGQVVWRAFGAGRPRGIDRIVPHLLPSGHGRCNGVARRGRVGSQGLRPPRAACCGSAAPARGGAAPVGGAVIAAASRRREGM